MTELIGRSLGTRTVSYTDHDVMLYALTIGAHATDLELVYERDLKVLPTFALPLGLWAVEAAGGLGAYDRSRSLHAGQELTMVQPMPTSGSFDTLATIANVWDKGSAAVVEIAVSCDFFTATYAIFVPGAGGFGGERGPSTSAQAPEGAPTWTTQVVTTENQAALYRLTGDRHPVHIDPALARAAGFERPILHGLCTLGAVVLATAATQDRSAVNVEQLTARFSAPVLPGDTINLSGWTSGDVTTYVASVDAVGPVLSGQVRWA